MYLADQTSESGLCRRVAIKVLHDRLQSNSEASKRIRDEARILGHIEHRGVVKVLDLIQLEGRWAVVMDFLPGIDIDRLIAFQVSQSTPLPLSVIIEIGADVAAALHAAYSAIGPKNEPLQIVHRDIKPSNIRITQDGEVKVMDFGIAQVNMEAREADTRTDALMGTLGYLAPERITLSGNGPKGDVYALCATLFEAVIGTPIGRSPVLESKHIAFVEYNAGRALEKLGEKAGASAFVAWVAQGLSYHVEDRPSAQAMCNQLSTLLDETTGHSLKTFCMAFRWEELEAATGKAELTLGLHMGGEGYYPEEKTLAEFNRAPDKLVTKAHQDNPKIVWLALMLTVLVGLGMTVILVQGPRQTQPFIEKTMDVSSKNKTSSIQAVSDTPSETSLDHPVSVVEKPTQTPLRQGKAPIYPQKPQAIPQVKSVPAPLEPAPLEPPPLEPPPYEPPPQLEPPPLEPPPLEPPPLEPPLQPQSVPTKHGTEASDGLSMAANTAAIDSSGMAFWNGSWTGHASGQFFSLKAHLSGSSGLSGRAVFSAGSQSRSVKVSGDPNEEKVIMSGDHLVITLEKDGEMLESTWTIGRKAPIHVYLRSD